MIHIKLKSKLRESGPSGNINYGVVKSDDPQGLIYTLIDCKKLVNFCQQLKNNYENSGADPDISDKILIDQGIVISSVRIGQHSDCGNIWSVLTSGVSPEYRGQRQGEKLYRYIFSQFPNGLSPDRNYVSDSARALWKRLVGSLQLQSVPLSAECGLYPQTDPDHKLLNHAYKGRGEDASAVLSSAETCLDQCSDLLEGLWDRDSLIFMIDGAGKKLYDQSIAF